MLFSVIYSFDTPGDESVNQYYPQDWRKLWDLTECDLAEYDYHLPLYERPKHRKIVALLTKDEFVSFVADCGLTASSCETMGSLGAPGFGFGWAPAISFELEYDGHMQGYANAYVTPIPFTKLKDDRPAPHYKREIVECVSSAFPLNEQHWARIRNFIVNRFGRQIYVQS
jgi:hypothetical protein